jgi:hypothetical protein
LCRAKGLTVRLRKQRNKKKYWYVMTVKTRVKADRVVEIEKSISEEDFDEMRSQASGWVTKTRYVVGLWEIDFFKNEKDETYFIMAEIELPDGVKKPSKVPALVTENLLYEVPIEDVRFSSKKLSDIDYARKLLDEIGVQSVKIV